MRILLRTLVLHAMLLVSRLDVATQQLSVRTQTEDYPEARPADVTTLDGLVAAPTKRLMVKRGNQGIWSRIQSLYHPQVAWHMPVYKRRVGSSVSR